MTSGLPSGLRVSDWKTAPAIASAMPEIRANSRRGSRHSTTTMVVRSSADRRSGPRRPRRGSAVRADGQRVEAEHDHDGGRGSRHTATARTVEPRREPARPTPDDGRRPKSRLTGAHSPLALRRRASTIRTGAPMNAVTSPTRSSPLGRTTRPTTSETSSSTAAADHRVRDDPALVGAGEPAHRVRHHQADERDRPGERGRGAREQRHGDDRQPRGSGRCAHPAPAEVVAEREALSGRASTSASTSPATDERRDGRDESSDRPPMLPTLHVRVPANTRGNLQRDHLRDATEHGSDRDARERELLRGRLPRPGRADHVDDGRGDQGAQEGEPDVPAGQSRSSSASPSAIARAAPAFTPRMPGSASGLRV